MAHLASWRQSKTPCSVISLSSVSRGSSMSTHLSSRWGHCISCPSSEEELHSKVERCEAIYHCPFDDLSNGHAHVAALVGQKLRVKLLTICGSAPHCPWQQLWPAFHTPYGLNARLSTPGEKMDHIRTSTDDTKRVTVVCFHWCVSLKANQRGTLQGCSSQHTQDSTITAASQMRGWMRRW